VPIGAPVRVTPAPAQTTAQITAPAVPPCVEAQVPPQVAPALVARIQPDVRQIVDAGIVRRELPPAQPLAAVQQSVLIGLPDTIMLLLPKVDDEFQPFELPDTLIQTGSIKDITQKTPGFNANVRREMIDYFLYHCNKVENWSPSCLWFNFLAGSFKLVAGYNIRSYWSEQYEQAMIENGFLLFRNGCNTIMLLELKELTRPCKWSGTGLRCGICRHVFGDLIQHRRER
jgi:hypothetical protein